MIDVALFGICAVGLFGSGFHLGYVRAELAKLENSTPAIRYDCPSCGHRWVATCQARACCRCGATWSPPVLAQKVPTMQRFYRRDDG